MQTEDRKSSRWWNYKATFVSTLAFTLSKLGSRWTSVSMESPTPIHHNRILLSAVWKTELGKLRLKTGDPERDVCGLEKIVGGISGEEWFNSRSILKIKKIGFADIDVGYEKKGGNEILSNWKKGVAIYEDGADEGSKCWCEY